MQDISHIGSLSIGEHDEFDVGDRFIVVQFILSRTITDKTSRIISVRKSHSKLRVCKNTRILASTYLSSGPPSLRTIFRNEKIVPKMSFASSCALNFVGLALAGPKFAGAPVLAKLDSEVGLAFFV